MLGGKLCIGSALKEHPLEYCMSESCCEILSTLHLTHCLHTASVVHICRCIWNSLWDLGKGFSHYWSLSGPCYCQFIGCHFLQFSNTNIIPPAIQNMAINVVGLGDLNVWLLDDKCQMTSTAKSFTKCNFQVLLLYHTKTVSYCLNIQNSTLKENWADCQLVWVTC